MPRIWLHEEPSFVLGGQYPPDWQFMAAAYCRFFQPAGWVSLVRNIQVSYE